MATKAKAVTTKRTARSASAGGPAESMPTSIAPLAYGVLTLLLFREFIFSREALFGSDTFLLGYFARDFYQHFIRSFGEFPLWNPLLFGGLPFIEGMHGDIFYPTTILLFLLDVHRALGWRLILHIFLAGLLAYGWLRSLGIARPPALFGGGVYMLGSHLVSLVYPGHDGKIFVATLAPLAFWLTERAVRQRRLADFAYLGLAVALLIYTAHMQLAYFAIWGFTLYFLFRLAQIWRAERRAAPVARLFGLFALAGVLGAGAASVQLLPPLIYLRGASHRAAKTVEAEAERGYAYSTSWSLHPEEVAALVVPEFVGGNIRSDAGSVNTYWGRNLFKLNHEYAGFVPLLLVPLLFFRRRSPRSWFFLGLAVVSLLYAVGATTPVFHVFYALIPGVKLFRAPSSIMFLFGLSVATLGALGVQRLLDCAQGGEEERRVARRYLWAVTGIFAVLAIAATSGSALTDVWRALLYRDIAPDKLAALERNLPNIRAGLWITCVLAGLAAAVFEALTRRIVARHVALAAIALLAVLDLWRVDRPFIQTIDPRAYSAADESIDFLRNARAEGQVFRALALPGTYQTNLLAIHGIEQLGGHHGNEMGRYRELVGGEQLGNIAASDLRLLDLANVRYLVSPRPLAAPGFTEVFRGTTSLVYENRRALPRAFLVGRTEVVADSDAVERVLMQDFDFRNVAALPEPLPTGVAVQPDPHGEVHWQRNHPNGSTLRVVTDRPALLVVTNNYFESWQAEVDGEPAPVLRADYTFRAVPVPAGEHVVRFAYRSRILRASAAASAVTLVLLIGVGIGGSLRSRRQRSAERD